MPATAVLCLLPNRAEHHPIHLVQLCPCSALSGQRNPGDTYSFLPQAYLFDNVSLSHTNYELQPSWMWQHGTAWQNLPGHPKHLGLLPVARRRCSALTQLSTNTKPASSPAPGSSHLPGTRKKQRSGPWVYLEPGSLRAWTSSLLGKLLLCGLEGNGPRSLRL